DGLVLLLVSRPQDLHTLLQPLGAGPVPEGEPGHEHHAEDHLLGLLQDRLLGATPPHSQILHLLGFPRWMISPLLM
ncbi:hypothetical protein NDU88_001227, partial [Pleurodeles waltl]